MTVKPSVMLGVALAIILCGCFQGQVASKNGINDADLADLKVVLQTVVNANLIYYRDNGHSAPNVHELIQQQYLTVDEKTLGAYQLQLGTFSADAGVVTAKSTINFKGGPGWVFTYNSENDQLNILPYR